MTQNSILQCQNTDRSPCHSAPWRQGGFVNAEVTDRPQPRHAAARAMAFDVSEAIGGKLLDGGVQWVHDPQHSSTARAPEVRFKSNIEKGDPPLGAL